MGSGIFMVSMEKKRSFCFPCAVSILVESINLLGPHGHVTRQSGETSVDFARPRRAGGNGRSTTSQGGDCGMFFNVEILYPPVN